MAILDINSPDEYTARVVADRPEFTHHPFFSWEGGLPPAGFFKKGDPTMATFFKENGFLVLQDAFTAAEIDLLSKETTEICRGERGLFKGIEPAAPDDTDADVLKRYLCIHFPHKISKPMFNTLGQSSITSTLTQVIGPNVKCMQSMLFIKASGKPGQAWHQDEFYIPTRDRSLLGAWIAMDDATVENGCLWVIPGSHKHGILWPQHQQRDRRFDCANETTSFPYTDDDAVPVEVKKGTVVFFNGYLLHRSLPNYSEGAYRRALVNHYMSAESLLPWMLSEQNKSIASTDYRDIVMVAGKDPYAWKGIEERAAPHVRPSGEGGCGNINRNTEALKSRNMVLLEEEADDHDH
ncbi:MAG: phytanoyl-CoA dioxygenase family protein [Chloroflexi bacterium]|nr:phytanoyl-CoA dioxygenase family protein [Chloroflexota bacterium]